MVDGSCKISGLAWRRQRLRAGPSEQNITRMRPASPPVDPTCCPLCGGSNGCALEAERAGATSAGPCWCTQARFPPALRARVAAPAQGKACICAACAGAFDAAGNA